MSSLTQSGAQWSVGKSAAVIVQPVTFFQDATSGRWMATTNPSDAIGNTTAKLVAGSGNPVLDPTATSGMKVARTPTALIAY